MRSRFPVAVHLFFMQAGVPDQNTRVLLLRRYHTGWEDGKYSVPAGHLEVGESVTAAAVREAREEVGVTLASADLAIVHVMNRHSDEERVDYFFLVRHWTGEVTNAEPNKCDDLSWFPLDALPPNVIPYVRAALDNYTRGVPFSEFGWQPR